MDDLKWITSDKASEGRSRQWKEFLTQQKINLNIIESINFTTSIPVIKDKQGRVFCIDFVKDRKNYFKKKGTLKTEMISRALGAGRLGLNVLDLSAGLGVDAIFLSQLGYQVTAIERNPLIFLSLKAAADEAPFENVKFLFASAADFLKSSDVQIDIIYFDPMFPEKKKSALSKQEIMFFRDLVGGDSDASSIVELVISFKKAKRLVIKRSLKAELLYPKPQSQIFGKLIRFDVYGAAK